MQLLQDRTMVLTSYLLVVLGTIFLAPSSKASEAESIKTQVIAQASTKFGMSASDLKEEHLTVAATSQDNGQAAYHVVGQFTLGWTSQRKPDEVAQLIANQNRCAFAGADCEPGIHHTIYVDVIAAQSQSSSSLDISGEESLDKTIEEQRHEVAINESAGDPSKLAALSNPPNCKPIVVSRFTLAPTMPPLAIREHHTGTTVLQIVLNSDGTIADIKVYESSGFHELDRAAVQVTWRWSYAPVVCAGSGQPAMATIRVPLTFSLQKKLEPVVPQP